MRPFLCDFRLVIVVRCPLGMPRMVFCRGKLAMPVIAPRRRRRGPAPVFDDTGACLRIPPSAHTLAGFRAWLDADDFPDKVRVTFLEREVLVDMSKEEL